MEILLKPINTLTSEDIALWESSYSSERISAVNRKLDNDKILSICGDLLVLNAFKSRFPDKEFRVSLSQHGKPYLKENEFYFNVSHKSKMAVCIIDDSPVGIDIEDIKPFNKQVAKRICTEQELTYIGEDAVRFAEIWTVKEAYSKLMGRGISMGLCSIIIDIKSKTVCGLPFFTEKIDGYVYSWVVIKK